VPRRNSRVSTRTPERERAKVATVQRTRQVPQPRTSHAHTRARIASHASAALTLDCARHTLDAIRETIVSPHRFKRCGLSQECAAAALSATDIPTCDRTNLVPNSFQAFTSSFTANNDAPGRVIFRRPRQAGRTGTVLKSYSLRLAAVSRMCAKLVKYNSISTYRSRCLFTGTGIARCFTPLRSLRATGRWCVITHGWAC
jgi:hypothetical protein